MIDPLRLSEKQLRWWVLAIGVLGIAELLFLRSMAPGAWPMRGRWQIGLGMLIPLALTFFLLLLIRRNWWSKPPTATPPIRRGMFWLLALGMAFVWGAIWLNLVSRWR